MTTVTWPQDLATQHAAVTGAAADIAPEWAVGLRVVHGWGYFAVTAPAVGDLLAPSHHWEDGTPTEMALGGTSALRLARVGDEVDPADLERALRRLATYQPGGCAVVLLAGDHAGRGTDPGEVLLRGAEVMAVWGLDTG